MKLYSSHLAFHFDFFRSNFILTDFWLFIQQLLYFVVRHTSESTKPFKPRSQNTLFSLSPMYLFSTESISIITIFIISFATVLESTEQLESCQSLTTPGAYSYDIISGKDPANWGTIAGFETCASGLSQSPIDFPSDVNILPLFHAPKPSLRWSTMKVQPQIENWSLNCNKSNSCGYTIVGQEKFYVQGLHFHAPSEHTLDGKQYPLEVHLVHRSASGDLAVIATLFDHPPEQPYRKLIRVHKHKEQGRNMLLQNIWTQLFISKQKIVKADFRNLVRWNYGICSYNGSLTTPPCTENVWFFMQLKIQQVSRQQVNMYSKSVGSPLDGTNRPLQPRNNREVTCFLPQMQ